MSRTRNSSLSSIEGMRGTRVTLEARANRSIASAELVLDIPGGIRIVQGRIGPSDAETMAFDFVLDQDAAEHIRHGSAKITFRSKEGETNDRQPKIDVVVVRDEIPTSELTSPPKDPELK